MPHPASRKGNKRMMGVEPIAIVGARTARPVFHDEKAGTIPADNIKEDTP